MPCLLHAFALQGQSLETGTHMQTHWRN